MRPLRINPRQGKKEKKKNRDEGVVLGEQRRGWRIVGLARPRGKVR